MSAIDSELSLLKARLAVLKEQKRIETEKEAEKMVNPMKILKAIIDEKKQRQNLLASAPRGGHARPSIPKGVHMSTEDQVWVFDQNDKVEFLEPIFNMLKKIEERLNILENKKKDDSIENLVFKILRRNGYIEKLMTAYSKILDDRLSMEQ